MKCFKGHELEFQADHAQFTEYWCPECNQSYWQAIFLGLHRYEDDDPCEEGCHDWKPIFEYGDEVGYECVRCGLIDA